jgi:hypothetical protein
MTAREEISKIHRGYLLAGADIIKTNTFGALPWVLEDYGIGERTYELAKEGARIVKEACMSFATEQKPRFCAAAFGPGTKLPSLGHIAYDEMYEGYKIAARGVVDGGDADLPKVKSGNAMGGDLGGGDDTSSSDEFSGLDSLDADDGALDDGEQSDIVDEGASGEPEAEAKPEEQAPEQKDEAAPANNDDKAS